MLHLICKQLDYTVVKSGVAQRKSLAHLQLAICASGKLQAHPPIPQVFLTLTALQTYSNAGGGGGGYGGYSQYGGYSPGYEQTHRGGFIVAGHSTLRVCC